MKIHFILQNKGMILSHVTDWPGRAWQEGSGVLLNAEQDKSHKSLCAEVIIIVMAFPAISRDIVTAQEDGLTVG